MVSLATTMFGKRSMICIVNMIRSSLTTSFTHVLGKVYLSTSITKENKNNTSQATKTSPGIIDISGGQNILPHPSQQEQIMAYVSPNFKTKKAFKAAFKAGNNLEIFQPGIGSIPYTGTICVEGPHNRHTWYATAHFKEGKLVKVT